MFDIYNLGYVNGHRYSFVLESNSGILKSKDFSSRNAANREMYKDMGKYGLSLRKVWDDKHDKTYICDNGYEFHINRLV